MGDVLIIKFCSSANRKLWNIETLYLAMCLAIETRNWNEEGLSYKPASKISKYCLISIIKNEKLLFSFIIYKESDLW